MPTAAFTRIATSSGSSLSASPCWQRPGHRLVGPQHQEPRGQERPSAGPATPVRLRARVALQHQGWRWLETYIWSKPNAVPGRFGPRTKDSFEYVYAFARGPKPHFDLDAIRVPYKTTPQEIARRKLDKLGRRNTDAGFGRDRTTTYLHGGADPGNVVSVPQTYNQHKGAGGHTAAMPEGLAEFFIKACSPDRRRRPRPVRRIGYDGRWLPAALVARPVAWRFTRSFVAAARERLRVPTNPMTRLS